MFRIFSALSPREKSLIVAASAFAVIGMIALALLLYFAPPQKGKTGFPAAQTREEQLQVIASLRELSAETPPVPETVKDSVREDMRTIDEGQKELSEAEKEHIRASLRSN